jgi:hypothetical protein
MMRQWFVQKPGALQTAAAAAICPEPIPLFRQDLANQVPNMLSAPTWI